MVNPDIANPLFNFHNCKLCSYKTRFLPSILKHVRLHRTRSKDRRFVCDLQSPERYQCEKCQIQTHLKVLLINHFNTVHKTKETEHNYQNPVLQRCENCGFETYSSLVSLRHKTMRPGYHILTTTSEHGYLNSIAHLPPADKETHQQTSTKDNNSKLENEKTECLPCDDSSQKFTTKKLLQVHENSPSGQIDLLKCEHCSYETKLKRNLIRHVFKQHNMKNCFKCEHCSYETKWKSSLIRHLFTIHAKKSFKCEHCSYKTTMIAYLRDHILRKHTPAEEINWFTCEQCTYKAKLKKVLRKHIRKRHTRSAELTPSNQTNCHVTAMTHTQPAKPKKVKRFKCDQCFNKFTRSENLRNHIYQMHTPFEQINWFTCEHCPFKAKQKSNLGQHVVRMHK